MTYLLIYSNSFGNIDSVKALLNDCPLITDWRSDIPNAFLMKSDSRASDLASFFIEKKPNSRFFITEIATNRQGWLPQESWQFIKQ